MKKGDKATVHWGHVAVILIAVALAGYVSQGEITGQIVYRDADYGGFGGYGGGGFMNGFSFLEFYQNYAPFVDAVIFLLIFLSIGKTILGTHFKKGGQALYAGVGLFLALALLLWEEQNQFYLLEEFGIFALLILIVLVLVIVGKALHVNTSRQVAIPIIIFFTFLAYKIFADTIVGIFGQTPFIQTINEWFSTIMWISIIWIILTFLFRRTRPGQATWHFMSGRPEP
tara:strand:- start:3361 stop:4044 length:684 start_codon:yes stop_codon:yes gene_type:complete